MKDDIFQEIMDQREEILKAFFAKYGLEPDLIEQVVEYLPHRIVWTIRPKGILEEK